MQPEHENLCRPGACPAEEKCEVLSNHEKCLSILTCGNREENAHALPNNVQYNFDSMMTENAEEEAFECATHIEINLQVRYSQISLKNYIENCSNHITQI